ncbi:MAG: ABC transporter ATP-binding protein [Lachnoanaerobaculum sp.]|jgi:oligopeptide/dipeptide ABC transporter, ATP-binding protein, C-terminal domain|uniref:ABC transporter ATP-binding protein n=1 Tax=unclassified Lachnoanaerobaculum TaxID=2625085 RepID=UPI00027A5DEA|nr:MULTISPECIES: ABC transporter ATP-binding protein [unclassified Lachnoanaerobaculum]EJP25488.1 oligopeptide ABC transporter, ATP-binding protein AppD [Lachnoanaerobaculum sp. ICM7]MBF1261264.1 ABC transporter ATP-binding protein [Lachnoanaerobaculum sp.]MBS5883097.1 ABC transporter ATP-binding protein [Lachnoanaerobaculum sp.]
MDNILTIRDLKVAFQVKGKLAYALDGINIDIPKGKIVGIVGESGCGKSMTAMSIMGLIKNPGKIVGGSIDFCGTELTKMSVRDYAKIRGKDISMIFQEPMTSLNPVVKVGKQVMEAIILHEKISKEEAKMRVIEIFNEVGIPEAEKRFNSYPHELSGGLRQRVMIGMAMICKPKLLIADEPTTALDVTIEAQILKLMKKLCESVGTSIIMITHNMGVVAEICDYVYVMYAGRVVESTLTKTLFNETAHPYTNGLLKSIPTIGKKQDRLYTIKGNVPNILNLPKGCRFVDRCDYAQDICFSSRPADEYIKDNHMVSCFLHKRIEDEKCSIKFKKHS